jgi:nicotinate-nucleotide adenylyltransferase
MKITAFEQALGSPYTAHTLSHVRNRKRGVHFIWIMGADGLRNFHRWQEWRSIVHTFPIAIIDRPGSTLSFLSSKMTCTFDYARIDEDDAGIIWQKRAPAWTFIHGPRSTSSSTNLRQSTLPKIGSVP